MKHTYNAHSIWDGNLGDGTSSYARYGRDYHVDIAGKPELPGSADPMFRGAAERHNPEDLFLASISTCHMLSYLALCARRGVRVLAYEDRAQAVLAVRPDGSGTFESVTLSPVVTIAQDSNPTTAMALHEAAHAECFVASSCRVPIDIDATCRVESESPWEVAEHAP
jgi:organic hydroperoxide reductase OsmC/OhrA